MSKLSKYKEWLTLEEIATRLSNDLSEPVTKADVLRLALDGHLKLSVNFLNSACAFSGKVIPLSEATYADVDDEDESSLSFYADECYMETYDYRTRTHGFKKYKPERQMIIQEEYFNGTEFFKIDRKKTINGIWDIVITAGAETHLENKLQYLINGSPKKMTTANEVYISGVNGEVCQLLRYFFNKEQPENKSDKNEFCSIIVNKEIEEERKFRQEIASKRNVINKGLIADRTKLASSEDYFPPGIEQDGGVLVVRKSAIADFEFLLKNGTEKTDNKDCKNISSNTKLETPDDELEKFIKEVIANYPEATSKDIISHCFVCYKGNNSKLNPIKDIIADLGIEHGGSGKRSHDSINYMKKAEIYKPSK